MRRLILFILLATPAIAQVPLTYTLNGKGLTALALNGTSILDAATIGVAMDNLTWDPLGTPRSYFRPTVLTNGLSGSTASQTYGPAAGDTASAQMVFSQPSSNTLECDYSVTNGNVTDSLKVTMTPFGLDLPGVSTQFAAGSPITLDTHSTGQGFLSGTWGSVAWWTSDIGVTGTHVNQTYGSSGQVLFRPPFQNEYTIGPSETLQTFATLIAPGATVTWHLFLRVGLSTDTNYSLVPESFADFGSAVGNNINNPDRRPIGQIFWTTSGNETSINPRGYNGSTLNALNPTTFATFFNGMINNTITNLAKIGAQAVVLWDADGQEFNQSVSYVGLSNGGTFANSSPEMDTVIDAGVAKILAAGYRVGFTLRPQHLLYGTSLPGTCNFGPSAGYNDVIVITTAPNTYPSSTRIYNCTATNTWTADGPGGPGHQTAYLTSAYTNIIAELEAKVTFAVNRWGASIFYVDSTVFEGGTAYQWELWKQIKTDFPNIQFFPEDLSNIYSHYGWTSPYRKASTLGVLETSTATRQYFPTAYSVVDLNDALLSGNQAAIQDGVAKGDVSAVRVWFSETQQTTLNTYRANAQVTNSSMVITDTNSGNTLSFSNNPGTSFKYPLVTRAYFATSSAGLGSSTTYCEMKGVPTCFQAGSPTYAPSINLSGMACYQLTYYDFTGAPVHFNKPAAVPVPGSLASCGGLVVSNVFTENFDTTTPTPGLWTINSDPTASPGPALTWYTTGTNPGFRTANYGHGGASAAWPIGTGNFTFSAELSWESGNNPGAAGISYSNVTPVLNGQAVEISTDPIGSQGPNTISISIQANQAGPLIDVRQGIPFYQKSVGTATAGTSTSGTFVRNNADSFMALQVGQTVWLQPESNAVGKATASCIISGFTSSTTITYNSCSATITTGAYFLKGDNVITTQLGQPYGPLFGFPAYSIPWFAGQALSQNPPILAQITRSGNTITWNLYTAPIGSNGQAVTGVPAALQLASGTVPIGVNQMFNMIGGNQTTLSGSAATASLGYINVVNVNDDHTGWLGGNTSPGGGTPVSPPGVANIARVSNIHGYGAIASGSVPTITSIIPTATTGSAELIQTGNTIAVNGTGFNPGSSVRIGVGTNLHTASATFVSSSQLTFTAPSESNGTYRFSVVDPTGVDIVLPKGITYSGVTLTRLDPHEFSTGGGDAITITGAGIDSTSTLTLNSNTCTSFVVINSQKATCNVPAGTVGIPTVVLTSSAGGSFTSSNTDPVLLKGYTNHPYLQFDSTGLTTLQSSWAGSTWNDYTEPLKRDVSVSAWLSASAGTFGVGDTVTQGSVSGVCYDAPYGFLVIAPTSAGTFAAGAITDTTSGATGTIALIGTLPGMLDSFTAPVTGATGTFNVGDTVTQGAPNTGVVYKYVGGTIGIETTSGSFGINGQTTTITGPSGSGVLGNQTPNSPNDNPYQSWGGVGLNNWTNYAWYDILSNSTTYPTAQIWNGSGLLGGADSLNQELQRISFLDHWDQYFTLQSQSAQVALFYDANWANLTQDQKTSLLNYLDKVNVLGQTLVTNADTFVNCPVSPNNWCPVSNGSLMLTSLAVAHSNVSVLGTGTPFATTLVGNMRSKPPSYPQVSYALNTFDPGGVDIEGSQYTGFGMAAYLLAGYACINTTSSGSCNATGLSLFASPNFLLNSVQTDLTLGGDVNSFWQTYNDTQPQQYNVHVLSAECGLLSNNTLCYTADQIAHFNATNTPFTKWLNWNASNLTYALPAFIWRSTSSGSSTFGGFSTERTDSANLYGIMRSTTAFQPNLVIGMKGHNTYSILTGHRETDTGSFVADTQGEKKFIDPGYFLPTAAFHSTTTVAGNSITIGSTANVSTFDNANAIDSPNFWSTGCGKESIPIDYHAAYNSGVTSARRTISTYCDKAFIVLDDITPSVASSPVVSSFQTGFNFTQSGAGNVTNTIAGANSNLACTFYGPTSSSWSATKTGPNSWTAGTGNSWVFNNLAVQWYTLKANYTISNNSNPLVTVCIDSAAAPTLTVSTFTNTGSVITIAFSDGNNYVYNLTSGTWILQ